MKIKLEGKIVSMDASQGGSVKIRLPLAGRVEAPLATGKEAEAELTLSIRALFAERIKFGQKVEITLETHNSSTEEST